MILILVALICGSDGSLNEKVVEFARSKLGQQVGNGQCNALAVEALRHSGGRRRGAREGIWGDELESLRDVKPGDILQFENVVFISRRLQDDGSLVIQTRKLPHHTAIIAQVRKRGTKPILVILHQNVDNNPIVQEWTIDMAEKKRGSVKGYRPLAD
ncbi:MAG TPA: hypothetical protein VKA15_07275 [Isosphaeraceae bacterium]|nr:hypothetical protein [Isosphaeraceae bacterium]